MMLEIGKVYRTRGGGYVKVLAKCAATDGKTVVCEYASEEGGYKSVVCHRPDGKKYDAEVPSPLDIIQVKTQFSNVYNDYVAGAWDSKEMCDAAASPTGHIERRRVAIAEWSIPSDGSLPSVVVKPLD